MCTLILRISTFCGHIHLKSLLYNTPYKNCNSHNNSDWLCQADSGLGREEQYIIQSGYRCELAVQSFRSCSRPREEGGGGGGPHPPHKKKKKKKKPKKKQHYYKIVLYL